MMLLFKYFVAWDSGSKKLPIIAQLHLKICF